MRLMLYNQATASRRRVFFHLVDATDGITPETGEAGGQPQISTDGGAFGDAGIGTLVHCGNGRYYAELTQAAIATAGARIETRYKSANTAECPGESVHVVGYDPSLPKVEIEGMGYIGDVFPTDNVYIPFKVKLNGVLTAITGVGVAAYKADGTSTTTGVTVQALAGTGFYQARVETSNDPTFFTEYTDFTVVFTAGTVGGVSIAGETPGSFSVRSRYASNWNSKTQRYLTGPNNIVLVKDTHLLGFNDPSGAQIWSYANRSLTDYGTLVADVTAAVWAAGTRTLTGFGTLIADLWAYATRSLTDKDGFAPTAAENATATAAQVTADHGAGSYVRNTEPDNTGIGNAAQSAALVEAMLADLTEDDGGIPRFTANSLEQAPTGGGLTAQDVRDEVDAALVAMRLDEIFAVTITGPFATGSFGEAALEAINETNAQALTQQDVRDAMTLTSGAEASIDDKLNAIQDQTDRITELTVIDNNLPEARRGTLPLVRGDAYMGGRAVSLTFDTTNILPSDITGSTVWLRVQDPQNPNGALLIDIEGTITSAVGQTKTFRFELPASDTVNLNEERYQADVEVLIGGDEALPATVAVLEVHVTKDARDESSPS